MDSFHRTDGWREGWMDAAATQAAAQPPPLPVGWVMCAGGGVGLRPGCMDPDGRGSIQPARFERPNRGPADPRGHGNRGAGAGSRNINHHHHSRAAHKPHVAAVAAARSSCGHMWRLGRRCRSQQVMAAGVCARASFGGGGGART
eukprot:scaffold569_cov408-Prasinococcus_capsulatus_cf.AAC.8